MIISASRRTDIPAFYSQWFINRIRAGWCIVPNPLNMKQISKVSLRPEDVEAIIFWSKNPAPLLSYLDELDKLGYRYYFQFTLNDYPHALEPGVPSLDNRITTFLNLSRRLSPLRVIWRYDPIIISNFTPIEYHIDRFSRLAEELRGSTSRVMVSVVDLYSKTERRLSYLEQEEGFSFDRNIPNSDNIVNLLRDIAVIAKRNSMEIFSCAEERNYSNVGVVPGRCIDERVLNKIWRLNLKYKKDNSQRKYCLCMRGKDIGINDTCIHGCTYCYSTRDDALAERRFREHNPDSPILWGKPDMLTLKIDKDDTQIGLF